MEPFWHPKSAILGVNFRSFFGRRPKGAPRAPQERPKRPQEAPKGAPGGPQEAPKGPKSAPGGSKRASTDPKCQSRGLKARPRAPKSLPRRPQGFSEAPGSAAVFGKMKKIKAYAHKVFPKHLARQPFSEKSKDSNHSSKKHRKRLRSPISMNPKGLAINRTMKKGGRAAVIPLGEVNPAPATKWRSRAC